MGAAINMLVAVGAILRLVILDLIFRLNDHIDSTYQQFNPIFQDRSPIAEISGIVRSGIGAQRKKIGQEHVVFVGEVGGT